MHLILRSPSGRALLLVALLLVLFLVLLLVLLGPAASGWAQDLTAAPTDATTTAAPVRTVPRAPPVAAPAAAPQDAADAASPDAGGPSAAPPPQPRKSPAVAAPAGERRLVIHLGAQRFSYSEGGRVLRGGPVSTGRRGYGTPTGSYRVQGKQRHKVSSLYAGSNGRPASMPYAIQFRGNYFIHQGRLPGYPASHGCVRVRGGDAQFLFSRLRPGDPILITR